MNIWGWLFFIVFALWLFYEYIISMVRLQLEYLMVEALTRDMIRALSEVGEKALLSKREIKNIIDKIEKEIAIHDYAEWFTFKETFKSELTKELTKRLTEKIDGAGGIK